MLKKYAELEISVPSLPKRKHLTALCLVCLSDVNHGHILISGVLLYSFSLVPCLLFLHPFSLWLCGICSTCGFML